ncbi:MAG: SCO family protein [Planctomycetia bacterium]|nr:SCO family protein [Planctomycetia bacterium]
MPKYKLVLILVLTIAASVGGAWLARALFRKAPPTVPEVALPSVPAFSLTERNGTTVSNENLKGKVWIASFVFTRCSGTCPQVAATLARLQSELADVPDLRLVTFTIDPDRDTPDELKKYAERFRADPDRWLFLTGSEKEIHALANDGFHVLAKKRPDGKPGDEFDHSTMLVLVDKAGRIRDYYDGMPPLDGPRDQYEASLKRLLADARALAKE